MPLAAVLEKCWQFILAAGETPPAPSDHLPPSLFLFGFSVNVPYPSSSSHESNFNFMTLINVGCAYILLLNWSCLDSLHWNGSRSRGQSLWGSSTGRSCMCSCGVSEDVNHALVGDCTTYEWNPSSFGLSQCDRESGRCQWVQWKWMLNEERNNGQMSD